MNNNRLTFKTGFRDAIPIALGYFAVSMTFGVATVGYGFPSWSAILVSLTNFTGSGQALGVQLLAVSTTTLLELFVAMLIINVRYALMSVTVAQLLSPKVTLLQRFVIAFGVTDENFAVAVSRRKELTFSYLMGLEITAFIGWIGGTIVGALVGDVLPEVVMTAFGIALPAMFVAIVLPPCRHSKAITVVVLIAVAMSCAFYYIPGLNLLSKGWVYVICGVVSAIIGALLFPVKEDGENDGGEGQEKTEKENSV
ncbi:MAG: AzlC family ABC transporter permease [Clostridia bacterium]|nr:AzlC family ABC transporter permease [Clostridia bacterium]